MMICRLAVASSLAVTLLASADTIDAQFTGTGAGTQVHVDSIFFSGDVHAGQLNYSLTNGPANYNGNWITYCTDLSEHTNSSPNPYQLVSIDTMPGYAPMGAAKAAAIRDLYAYAGGAQLNANTSNTLAAAFQVAIWEILVDFDGNQNANGLDLDNGNFKVTGLSNDSLVLVQSLFASIGAVDSSAVDLVGLANDGLQDQIIQVPAPGALLLCGLGGLVAGGRRRR